MRRLLTITLALLFTASCASNSPKSSGAPAAEQPTEQQAADETGPSPDAKRFIRDASGWFPADTIVVGGMTAEQYWSFGAQFLPEGRRDFDDDAPGTAGAIKADLSAMMLERLGADLTGMKAMAFAAGHDSGAVVLFGDIELAADRLEDAEIDGVNAQTFRIQRAADRVTPGDKRTWVVRFEQPQEGMAVFFEKEHLQRALRARDEQQDNDDALTSTKANLDVPLFDDLPTGNLVVMATLDERSVEQLTGMPFPPPDQAGLSFGDDVTLILEGQAASLDGASRFIKQYRAIAEQQIEGLQRRAESRDTAEAVPALVGYHFAYAYMETFEEERTEGRITYSVAAPDSGLAMMGPGMLAAFAIPTFTRYLQRSKAAEAQGILRKMSDGAKAYFISEQKGCRGQTPCWHPGAKPGMPVQFSQYVFPGGTDVHVVSMPSVPTDGAKGVPKPTPGPEHGGTVKDPAAILDALGVAFQEPTYFRYEYTTGPGRGVDATATVTATSDFDGDGEPNHTVEVHLKIDRATQQVVVTPAVTMNEFE